MSTLRVHAPRLFDGFSYSDDQVLSIIDGKVQCFDQDISSADFIAKGLVVPGFIDLQVNGGGGALFNDAPSVDKVKAIMAAHSKYGTTAMMPTLITDNVATMKQAADTIAEALSAGTPGILGIHFEGPHLSVAKKGAHSEQYIRPISEQEWKILERRDIGQIMVTLAPETVSAEDVKQMVKLGIRVCIGHSNADYETAQHIVDAGATGFTHLFNAMSPVQGREPGVVGAALLNDNAYCGLIVDGHHVDYTTCKIALKAKPKGRVFLVTDAMPPVGTDSAQFDFFDRTVHLNNGKLTSTTGELAGSVLDMATAVRNVHRHVKLPLDEALRMATQYPAEFLYSNNNAKFGTLSIGAPADFVVLNDELEVQSTWIGGRNVYEQ